MKRHLANVLRGVAVAATHVAEVLDPQPPIKWSHPFMIYGDGRHTASTGTHATITWHPTG